MNDCERIEGLLIELLEREPTEGERADSDAHLRCCADCREMARQNQAIRAAYGAEPAENVGDEVATAVLVAARLEVAETRRWRRTALIVAAVAATVLLVIFGGDIGFRPHETPQVDERLSHATQLIEDGHFELALEQLAPLLATDASADTNGRLLAMRLRAEALEGLEAWEDAIAAYGELASEFPAEEALALRRIQALEGRQVADPMLRQLEALGYSR